MKYYHLYFRERALGPRASFTRIAASTSKEHLREQSCPDYHNEYIILFNDGSFQPPRSIPQ